MALCKPFFREYLVQNRAWLSKKSIHLPKGMLKNLAMIPWEQFFRLKQFLLSCFFTLCHAKTSKVVESNVLLAIYPEKMFVQTSEISFDLSAASAEKSFEKKDTFSRQMVSSDPPQITLLGPLVFLPDPESKRSIAATTCGWSGRNIFLFGDVTVILDLERS